MGDRPLSRNIGSPDDVLITDLIYQNSIQRKRINVPLFMDRHQVPGASAEDVAAAHVSDLSVAGKHGVEFFSYWFDSDDGEVFCFANAPAAKSMEE